MKPSEIEQAQAKIITSAIRSVENGDLSPNQLFVTIAFLLSYIAMRMKMPKEVVMQIIEDNYDLCVEQDTSGFVVPFQGEA